MVIKPIWISKQKRAKYQNPLRVALPEKIAYLPLRLVSFARTRFV